MEKKEKKYIVELSDENVKSADGYDWLQLLISVAYEPVMVETAIQLLPYTEPRKESCDKCMNEAEDLAYQLYSSKVDEAYKRGLENAWRAARKISSIMDYATRDKIFGLVITSNIFDENTASEAIEKIRQYEQEKEQQIQVGDEVRNVKSGWIAVVSRISDDNCLTLMDCNGARAGGYEITRFTKTGRHFPEIAEVLQKMKKKDGKQDG